MSGWQYVTLGLSQFLRISDWDHGAQPVVKGSGVTRSSSLSYGLCGSVLPGQRLCGSVLPGLCPVRDAGLATAEGGQCWSADCRRPSVLWCWESWSGSLWVARAGQGWSTQKLQNSPACSRVSGSLPPPRPPAPGAETPGAQGSRPPRWDLHRTEWAQVPTPGRVQAAGDGRGLQQRAPTAVLFQTHPEDFSCVCFYLAFSSLVLGWGHKQRNIGVRETLKILFAYFY